MNKFIKLAAHRIIRVVGRMLYRKHIWLISDRFWCAGDNGEAFFKFLQSKPINSVFAVSKSSSDYERLKKIGKVVPYDSPEHKLLLCIADVSASSHDCHIEGHPETPQFFLSHGITTRDYHDYYNKMNHRNYHTIVASEQEMDLITKPPYNLNAEQVFLTGYPRYDYLVNERSEKIITVAFTWRSYLWNLRKEDFKKTDYYTIYSSIFYSEELIRMITSHGYSIRVKLHPETERFRDEFSLPVGIILWDENTSYSEIYEKTSLMITDYSSCIYDFVYLKKPIIYYQPDYQHIVDSGIGPQYIYDYKDSGMGEVTTTVDELKKCVKAYLETDCKMRPIYEKRANDFFEYRDRNNCNRVYKEMLKILCKE
ncbi:CDP-Glycerol:Poly(glycerophosphate) glycerophosphotransferase [Lachnospiraceae bacterium YSD2013]|nr:CDP-Glycerol:Poly(glycerophosphate) glycerophosphotransferase [Lachnospiraceae bacterium YSD2013]